MKKIKYYVLEIDGKKIDENNSALKLCRAAKKIMDEGEVKIARVYNQVDTEYPCEWTLKAMPGKK